MILGYNTNGFAHHAVEDALEIIAELGYRSAALTLEREFFFPPDRSAVRAAAARLRPVLARTGLRVTIETGARFLLDPRRKHQPTLVSADPAGRQRRLEFLLAAVDLTAELQADSVSFWSGAADEEAEEATLFARLCDGVHALLDHARSRGVRLAFEPEPGMFIDTMAGFARLAGAFDDASFGLTLDVGHVFCMDDGDVAEHTRRWRQRLFNVHIEDMRRGVHEHLFFGEGEMDFPLVFAALRAAAYAGPVHVELSRHSHDAVNTARRAMEFLRPLI